MGRKKRWAEDMQARFEEGTFDSMTELSMLGEDRTDFVREAVAREIVRRRDILERGHCLKDADGVRFHEPVEARLTPLTSRKARSDFSDLQAFLGDTSSPEPPDDFD